MNVRLNITDMQSIAHHNGGKCLSKEYVDMFAPLEWMCKKGHTWDSFYSIIKQGSWCVQCIKDEKKQEYLEEIKSIAKKKGGICLSEKYINKSIKLKFRCSEEHLFTLTPAYIKEGKWCKQCNTIKRNELKLDALKLFAQKKGGKCLSLKYVSKTAKLKWQCHKGHVWSTCSADIKHKGIWCEKCRTGEIKNKIFKDLLTIAKKKNGKLLSLKYVSSNSLLKFECSKGHKWKTTSQHIKAGNWCPECAKQSRSVLLRKYSIKELQQVAKSRKGKLLSKKYINTDLPLKWQCEKGHIWTARTYAIITENSWCQICFNENKKFPIEYFQQLAIDKKGKLLSKKYVNIKTHLKWQCEFGHKWLTTPSNIQKGTWCPVCATNRSRKNTPHK